MTQYLQEALPDELIEAARVDGASTLRTFWSVALPAARPGAAMLGLFTFIATWTNFFWPFIILDPGNPTLPVALQQLQAAYFVDYSLVLNGVVLMALPPHRPVRLRREAARLRHHARSSQGMTAQPHIHPAPHDLGHEVVLVAESRPVPQDFVLGVATAAYQIEGARHEDGRTDSIWDTFSHTPGAVVNGDTGDVACDHYHRYAGDVALMKSLAMQSYRFSTSWARVCPDGGPVNAKGLDFYERLVDSLLDAGHRAVADALPLGPAAGARGPRRLDRRARRPTASSTTPWRCTTGSATGCARGRRSTSRCARPSSATPAGMHAPGRTSPADGLAAAHHLMLGHGRVVQALRERDAALELGLTLNFTVADPRRPVRPARRRRRAPDRRAR